MGCFYKVRKIPTPMQKKFALGLIDYMLGYKKTIRQVGRDAGYSESTVQSPMLYHIEKTKGVQLALKELVKPDVIADAEKVIRDGLKAEKVIVNQGSELRVEDFGERRKHAELILRLAGLINDGPGGRRETKVNIAILTDKIKDIVME